MQTFAVNFNAILGSNQVQGLIDEKSTAPKPHPTLTLAVAAVSHYSNVGPYISIGGACSSTVVFWCLHKGQSFRGAEPKESCEVAYHDQSCHGYTNTMFDI